MESVVRANVETFMRRSGTHFGKLGSALLAAVAAMGLCSCASPMQPVAPPANGMAAAGPAPVPPSNGVPMESPPFQPSGQWMPPGIVGPWPADEYVRDGGDRRLPARPGIQPGLLDLDTEDTVATFEDQNGKTH